MRHIVILRHAKAVPHGSRPTDFGRELADRGHEQMPTVGERLMGYLPAGASLILIHSPAVRTRETAELLAQALPDFHSVLRPDPDLWDSDSGEYLTVLQRVLREEPSQQVIGIVGHNPMISQLGGRLLDRHIELGTSGYLLLSFDDLAPDSIDMLGEQPLSLIDGHRMA